MGTGVTRSTVWLPLQSSKFPAFGCCSKGLSDANQYSVTSMASTGIAGRRRTHTRSLAGIDRSLWISMVRHISRQHWRADSSCLSFDISISLRSKHIVYIIYSHEASLVHSFLQTAPPRVQLISSRLPISPPCSLPV